MQLKLLFLLIVKKLLLILLFYDLFINYILILNLNIRKTQFLVEKLKAQKIPQLSSLLMDKNFINVIESIFEKNYKLELKILIVKLE